MDLISGGWWAALPYVSVALGTPAGGRLEVEVVEDRDAHADDQDKMDRQHDALDVRGHDVGDEIAAHHRHVPFLQPGRQDA